MNSYQTIDSFVQVEYIEKKSRFIGQLAPVRTREEAQSMEQSIKQQHRNATHNVCAYLLHDTGVEHCSDDGEPQGTAGIPALEVLKREGLFDVCVVITRYFGGILLGGSGLVRAYSHCCKLAVDAADRVLRAPCKRITVALSYELLGKMNHLLPKLHACDVCYCYEDQVYVDFFVRQEQAQAAAAGVIEMSNGKANVSVGQAEWRNFPLASC